MNHAEIRDQLMATKIDSVQLDPNGYCNLSCWYCPRAYAPNPPHAVSQMPIALLESILAQCASRDGVFAGGLRHVWTADYNEVLLYRHFPEMLDLFARYGFTTSVLSNGTLFNDQNIALIADHVGKGTIARICLNVPAGDPESYCRYTQQSMDVFQRVREGISKLLSALPGEFLEAKGCSIAVNGIDDTTPGERDGLLTETTFIPLMDMHRQVEALQRLFPRANVFPAGARLDRGGHLARYGVLSNRALWPKPREAVRGCRSGENDGGRPFGWLHVNAVGQTFLCCSDYEFNYVFGDLRKQSVEEVWQSEAHVDTIHRAFWSICRTCASAERG
jgi:MoaA/NifB/PqqE/SkfB family radical SAM enzyme